MKVNDKALAGRPNLMNTTTKILMSAGISALLIAALVVVGVATPCEGAGIFALRSAIASRGLRCYAGRLLACSDMDCSASRQTRASFDNSNP